MSATYQLLSETFPMARKRYRCIWCGEPIQIGEKHRHERSIYDGFQDHRWHLECNQAFSDEDETEFCPFENERPRKGLT